jgi:hypothetical protein
MFVKLMGKLFSQPTNKKKQRQMDCRANTAKALRMFLNTITALQSANDYDQNALDVLDQRVGWGARSCGSCTFLPQTLIWPISMVRVA